MNAERRAAVRGAAPRHRTRRSGRDAASVTVSARIVAGALFVIGMAVLAVLAAWPIYRSAAFPLVAGAATAAGFALAALSRLRGWSVLLTAALTAAAALVLGALVALPARWGDPAQLITTVPDVLLGAITGWKDLVTVDLPVGTYRNLLVPALLVFLVGTVVALRCAWQPGVRAVLAVPVGFGMLLFGLAFGRPNVSEPLRIGSWAIPAPVETFVGAAGLLLALGWLAWRAHDARRSALRRAAETSGVRVSRRRSTSDVRRGLLAAGMVAVAVVSAAVVAPAVAAGTTRDVLRSTTGPELAVSRAASPLATYRAHFMGDAADEVLFRFSADGGELPDRLRIATLTAYDGEVFRVHAAEHADARFVRVPSRLSTGPGDPLAVRVQIDRLDGIWLPTAGRLTGIRFSGGQAAALADGFYYDDDAQGAVQTARGGLQPGDDYALSAVAVDVPSLADVSAPGVAPDDLAMPDSVGHWLELQGVGTGGAGLEAAVALLRARGYLSHALVHDDTEPAPWMSDLGEYVFQPSAAGHSLARIDALFQSLLERETDADAQPGETLVAAVGDDEQFAVAAALIARQLGFPSRVVVGVRLDAGGSGLPACDDGVCRGRDLAAWLEVRASTGEWVAIDVTPQHAQPPTADTRRQRDPQNVTDVRPETAEEIVAPEPSQQDTTLDDEVEPPGVDLSALWSALRIIALALLALAVVTGPALLVLAVKALRRRTRRRETDAARRVVGGWDEFVDAAVDHGRPAPRTHTRTELAELYGGAGAATLAGGADRAVFSAESIDDAESAEFWRIVDDERRRFAREAPLWRRALAAVSLKSFVRAVTPLRGPSAEPRERRRRRRPDDDARAS